jgi:hypothetical protein
VSIPYIIKFILIIKIISEKKEEKKKKSFYDYLNRACEIIYLIYSILCSIIFLNNRLFNQELPFKMGDIHGRL